MKNTGNQEIWQQHYNRPRSRLHWPDENLVRWLSRIEPAGRILDLGTGSGRHLPLLSEAGREVIAADFAIHPDLPDYPAVRCDASELCFSDQSFDIVIVWGVLHYLHQDKLLRALDELYRVLRPGGRTFLTLRSHADTHLALQSGTGDLIGVHANYFRNEDIPALFSKFDSIRTGHITRTTLAAPGADLPVIAHWMIEATR